MYNSPEYNAMLNVARAYQEMQEEYKDLPIDKMDRALSRKAKPDLKSTRQQKKIIDTKRDHDPEAAKKQAADNKAGKGDRRKVSPAVLGGDRDRMDGKAPKDPYTGPEKRAELERAYKADDTKTAKLKRDRKRLNFNYKLDKKKEKQGVGSEAGQMDSDDKFFKKAVNLEVQRRDDLDKQSKKKIKRPKTRLKSPKRPSTIKKKK